LQDFHSTDYITQHITDLVKAELAAKLDQHEQDLDQILGDLIA